MAAHFTCTLYGTPSTFDGKQGGWQIKAAFASPAYKSFAPAGTVFSAVSPAITVGVASCNSIITVLPTGLSRNGQAVSYFSDSTIAQLNTLANA